ncbi:MAG: hypothetical protein ACERJ2_11790 [Filomicrobium sp.]
MIDGNARRSGSAKKTVRDILGVTRWKFSAVEKNRNVLVGVVG